MRLTHRMPPWLGAVICVWTVACSEPRKGSVATERHSFEMDRVRKQTGSRPVVLSELPVRSVESSASDVQPTDPRTLPIAGDPPYIDGFDPEEVGCPSGNWCGGRDAAALVAVEAEQVDPDTNCPLQLVGPRDATTMGGTEFNGISAKRTMQAKLNRHGTMLMRKDGNHQDSCCYHWFEYCGGA